MATIGELFSQQRKKKHISLKAAAADLLTREEILSAIENADWQKLPEPTIVQGFIKNYANYLKLDAGLALALFRREYDERKYPRKKTVLGKAVGSKITPARLVNLGIILAVLIFVTYLISQYLSILAAPKLVVSLPVGDDLTTNVPVVVVAGETELGSVVSIDGEFVAVDKDGNFRTELKLADGRNLVEIIASRRLSPKSKVVKVIRLVR